VRLPRYLQGWLSEVVALSMRRSHANVNRERPLFSLYSAIIKTKARGLTPVIAEFKRSSPSGFSQERDLLQYVKFMEENSAVGISILTEEKYFKGSYQDLLKAARAVKIPVLMKDFIVTESQIDDAYQLGADAVLLIVRLLTRRELCGLMNYAKTFGLESLVEVHDESDLEIASSCGARIVGLNSRDLSTLTVNLETPLKLLPKVGNALKVVESGISGREDLSKFKEAGADSFLVGSALMKDPSKIKELISV
jgi:Indole-3-glycerol phosphate synthase